MVGHDFVLVGKLVQHPDRVNNDVWTNQLNRLINGNDITGIQDQGAWVPGITRGIEHLVTPLFSKVPYQDMTRHSVAPEDQHFHERNPPLLSMLRISSLLISPCSELSSPKGTSGK
ncbi:hypothetical protein D3C81_957170 [compost metagenome]